ncbi:MAG: hypothetical protein H0T66_16520 [Geodermatophilaceae bacterium]|nr:hypothetical protein [Geodermatophilaceae bacterium]
MPEPDAVETRAVESRAPGPERLDRRTVVRRSAAVLAGAAGLLAAPALTGAAAADPGDTLRLGSRNKAGDAQTRLQSETTVASLSVLNERIRREESVGEVDLVAPQLRLATPIPGARRPQLPDVRSLAAGDLVAAGGLLYFGADAGDFDVLPSQVFTSTFANYLHPVPPDRATVFDSRSLTAEQRRGFAVGDFTADGRLAGKRRIAVDLRALVNTSSVAPRAAVALSLQVLAAQASGTLTLHPGAQSDGVEVLFYTVLPVEVTRSGQPYALPASGAAIVGLDREDRLWLALSSTAHLVVRVTGVFVSDPTVVIEAQAVNADASPYGRRVQRQREALRRLTATTRVPG